MSILNAPTNIYVILIAIITSIISCAKYLNIIQINSFYFNRGYGQKNITKTPIENSSIAYIISIITIF